jgi:hypothetical protein
MDTIIWYLLIFCDSIINFWKPPCRNNVIRNVNKSSESWKREAVVFASYEESDVVFIPELRIWNASLLLHGKSKRWVPETCLQSMLLTSVYLVGNPETRLKNMYQWHGFDHMSNWFCLEFTLSSLIIVLFYDYSSTVSVTKKLMISEHN